MGNEIDGNCNIVSSVDTPPVSSMSSDDVKSTESIDVVNLELSQQLVNTSSTTIQQVNQVEIKENDHSPCVESNTEDLAMSQQPQQDGGSECTNEPSQPYSVAYGTDNLQVETFPSTDSQLIDL